MRATKYLPEIVRFQHYLYDKYNYRLDSKEASRTSVGKFLSEAKNQSSKSAAAVHKFVAFIHRGMFNNYGMPSR